MVSVIALEEPRDLSLGVEEPVLSEDGSELVASDEAISVLVDSREGVACAEAWDAEEASAEVLCAGLDAEVHAEGLEEELAGVRREVLVARHAKD